ncbi:MAG: hypothetical protein HRU22_14200 [Gammaproteobacteria bacterium]|nr:hypothetical protein [Gammaproteobacteria bacterium]
MRKGKGITATVLFVFISLLFHLILVLIIVNYKVSYIAPQPTISIIKARLVVAMLPQKTEVKPLELPVDPTLNSIAAPKESLLSEHLVENVDAEEPSAKVVRKEPSAKVVNKQPSTATVTAAQIYAASQRVINDQNQQIIGQYAIEELAPTYSSNVSLSEMVSRPLLHRYIAPVMTVAKRRKVMIYCDSTAKKITAMVSRLLKGSIECEQLPDLQSFIDNRRLRRPKK